MGALLPLLVVFALWPPAAGAAQQAPFDRLPASVLDVVPPSARVAGVPGAMKATRTACRLAPAPDVRRRIVDLTVQEWGYFGFRILEQAEIDNWDPRAWRSRRRLDPGEAARVAASIAGYWIVTPRGDWILQSQNERWREDDGEEGPRWRFFWSAAFISWVMCESGLGEPDRFQRAIAHHTYIDQAIRAADGRTPTAAYAAYEVGEQPVAPGDLICTGRRPVYRSLAERRRQMGVGANTHCDIVVHVDDARSWILAVGGNVLGSVTLKVLSATTRNGRLQPVVADEARRPAFAHLKLRAEPIELEALASTPTM
ncbi:MAG: DUF2272 domain-containing protein, partial [Acidimicrobiia bacterium]|nr:DUF2272 domain-containing protein [Acidimicrobiia bacterium]